MFYEYLGWTTFPDMFVHFVVSSSTGCVVLTVFHMHHGGIQHTINVFIIVILILNIT